MEKTRLCISYDSVLKTKSSSLTLLFWRGMDGFQILILFFKFIFQLQLTYNIILVSCVQHSNYIFIDLWGLSRKYPAMYMKNRGIYWRRFKKHCTQDNDASGPFKEGTLGPPTVLLIAISCPIVFSWISLMVWNLFHYKGEFSFGTSQKLQGIESGL